MSKVNTEEIAREFHKTYERLAPNFGYATRVDTREFDPASPNGQLMQAVIATVIVPVLAVPENRLDEIARIIEATGADGPYNEIYKIAKGTMK